MHPILANRLHRHAGLPGTIETYLPAPGAVATVATKLFAV